MKFRLLCVTFFGAYSFAADHFGEIEDVNLLQTHMQKTGGYNTRWWPSTFNHSLAQEQLNKIGGFTRHGIRGKQLCGGGGTTQTGSLHSCTGAGPAMHGSYININPVMYPEECLDLANKLGVASAVQWSATTPSCQMFTCDAHRWDIPGDGQIKAPCAGDQGKNYIYRLYPNASGSNRVGEWITSANMKAEGLCDDIGLPPNQTVRPTPAGGDTNWWYATSTSCLSPNKKFHTWKNCYSHPNDTLTYVGCGGDSSIFTWVNPDLGCGKKCPTTISPGGYTPKTTTTTTTTTTTSPAPSTSGGGVQDGVCVGTEDVSEGTSEYDSPCFNADIGFGPDFSCATTEMWCGHDSGDGLVVGQCCPKKCRAECENKNKKGNAESRKKSELERKSKRSANEGSRKKAEKERKQKKKQDAWIKARESQKEKNEKAEDERKGKRNWDEKKRKNERKWKQGLKDRRAKADEREKARKQERGKKESRNKNANSNTQKEKTRKEKRKKKKSSFGSKEKAKKENRKEKKTKKVRVMR